MSDTPARDFVRQMIDADMASGKHNGRVCTRFPPEPNGFLHVGHAKSICLNFGVAAEYGGDVFLRFDDTNPGKESEEYVQAIKEDVRWLGFDWGERATHASDYFERLYETALRLIDAGAAYVDSLSAEEIREYRGTLTQAGKNSPHRERSVEENLDLFRRMRAGEFNDGEHILRAKIDMASPNINLRDPTIYRIRHIRHQHTADRWPIYPMYDYAHCLSDAYEGITHSLCTLEFEDHRPLYDWLIGQAGVSDPPQQIEFSRLNLAYALTSKRKLNELVTSGVVDGWDDPRLATIAGMRRRGYPPAAIRDFCSRIGVTKKDNLIEMGVLENSIREVLGDEALRRMAVLRPLKVVLTNFDPDASETLLAQNHPGRPELGERKIELTRELFVERDDFMEDAPRKFFRLKPGGEVRLRYAYIIRCDTVIKDAAGNVTELHCSYDKDTRSGSGASDRKVKGTIHWVSATHAVEAQVRLYDRLFRVPSPAKAESLADALNPDSLETLNARVEPALAQAAAGDRVQFERNGYFVADAKLHQPGKPTFNRIVTLRDSWAKLEAQAIQAEQGGKAV